MQMTYPFMVSILKCRLNRRTLKMSQCWCMGRPLILLPLSCILLSTVCFLSYCILIVRLSHCCAQTSNIIISLTSAPARFYHELPVAIYSLMVQTHLPQEIRLHLSVKERNFTLTNLKASIQRLDSSARVSRLFDKLVRIRYEPYDYGSATKFIPILKEFHAIEINRSSSQPIVICDDDHYYHPHTLATLQNYSNEFHNSIIGLRGWRVREDLLWGVYEEEYGNHVIETFRISHPYRVGVVTANYAYLIRPVFFDSHIYLDFEQAPEDVRRMDDIWLNGHAAKRNISRYVVPSCCPHIGVTRTHVLETHLSSLKISRGTANNHALAVFGKFWEKDLWYKFFGENAPHYRSGWMAIHRIWTSAILSVKFIVKFGFEY